MHLPSAALACYPCFMHPAQPGPAAGAKLAVGPAPMGTTQSSHPLPPLPCPFPGSLLPGPAPRAVSPSWASRCLAGCPEEPATEPPHHAAQRPGAGKPSTESTWEVEDRPREGCPWVLQRLEDQLQRTYLPSPSSQGISGDPRRFALMGSTPSRKTAQRRPGRINTQAPAYCAALGLRLSCGIRSHPHPRLPSTFLGLGGLWSHTTRIQSLFQHCRMVTQHRLLRLSRPQFPPLRGGKQSGFLLGFQSASLFQFLPTHHCLCEDHLPDHPN